MPAYASPSIRPQDARQRPKVFGVGWAKTGTTTLGQCLQILGYDHQSRRLDLVDDWAAQNWTRIQALAARKDSFEDWPWLLLYPQLDAWYPGSKFILTRRDPARWLQSYRNMLRDPRQQTPQVLAVRRTLYGLDFPNVKDRDLLARYQAHNAAVENYFAARPHDLLILDWEAGDGWAELCEFLQHPIPNRPLPHAYGAAYAPGPLRRLWRRLQARFQARGGAQRP